MVFAGPDAYGETAGNSSSLTVSSMLANAKVMNNGGLWVRCVVTDTFMDRTITSPAAAWSAPMTATTTMSGYTCTVKVSGGLGAKTYMWYGFQGQYYKQSSISASITMDSTRWSAYRVDVTDAAGFMTSFYINSTTGEITNTVQYNS